MQKTNIGWVLNDDGSPGYSWNPLKGRCLNECPYCYANAMRKRFKMYDGPLKLDEVELQRPLKRKKPCTIFVCNMNELFGPWVPAEWAQRIIDVANCSPHRMLYLTKFPRYIVQYEMKASTWVGATLTGRPALDLHRAGIIRDLPATYGQRFVSFEPLCGQVLTGGLLESGKLNWLIIGSLNKSGRPVPASKGGTRLEWVLPLLERADKLGIPVFIKKELLRLYPELPERREVPWIKN